jgi:hypothetical protein
MGSAGFAHVQTQLSKKQPLDSSQLDVLSGGVRAGVAARPVHDSFSTLKENGLWLKKVLKKIWSENLSTK